MSIQHSLLLPLVINVAIGIYLLEQNAGNIKILWFYIVFLILLFMFQVIIFIINTVFAYQAPEGGKHNKFHELFIYFISIFCFI